jgi:hypothetical protein
MKDFEIYKKCNEANQRIKERTTVLRGPIPISMLMLTLIVHIFFSRDSKEKHSHLTQRISPNPEISKQSSQQTASSLRLRSH